MVLDVDALCVVPSFFCFLLSICFALLRFAVICFLRKCYLSQCMGFLTVGYVQPAKP